MILRIDELLLWRGTWLTRMTRSGWRWRRRRRTQVGRKIGDFLVHLLERGRISDSDSCNCGQFHLDHRVVLPWWRAEHRRRWIEDWGKRLNFSKFLFISKVVSAIGSPIRLQKQKQKFMSFHYLQHVHVYIQPCATKELLSISKDNGYCSVEYYCLTSDHRINVSQVLTQVIPWKVLYSIKDKESVGHANTTLSVCRGSRAECPLFNDHFNWLSLPPSSKLNLIITGYKIIIIKRAHFAHYQIT